MHNLNGKKSTSQSNALLNHLVMAIAVTLKHSSGVVQGMAMSACWSVCQVVGPPCWPRVKYLSKCCMVGLEALYRRSWLPADPNDFPSRARTRLTFVVLSEKYQQLFNTLP